MSIQTKYKAYNASWGKFLGFVGVYSIADTASKYTFGSPLKQDTTGINNSPSTIIPHMIMGSYFAHNLYAQYQHNKSQEKQINVNIDGVIFLHSMMIYIQCIIS